MIKVFLVEDESLIREGLKENIPWDQYGYQFVGDASDGEMALPLIRATKPDVLITDIKMPFMDGLSLSKIVSQEFPKMKIIIISGYDDFEYARQAIELGVMYYLSKPITKMSLRKTLLELKEKIEQESEHNDYQDQFQSEMKDYEQFARRRFFERLFQGDYSVKDAYEEAAKLSLEIAAECYNLIFFTIRPVAENEEVENSEEYQEIRREIRHFVLRRPQFTLFRWNVNGYGVLVRGDKKQVDDLTSQFTNHITQVLEGKENRIEWHVSIGEKVERISKLKECYQNANHYMACRFVLPKVHILSEETLQDFLSGSEEKEFGQVDASSVDPQIIKDFLQSGSVEEVYDFVISFLQGFSDALKSKMFLDYMILNIRFSVMAFLDQLGVDKEEYTKRLEDGVLSMTITGENMEEYLIQIINLALEYRDKESDYQSRKILRKAQDYIDKHYQEENLSLNEAAKAVGVSPNYLSAVFSQSTESTFVEYVTNKRMEKAKNLLKTTDESSGDIALMVGYKDPHYFSFVFKKTQGMSPREYRSGKAKK